VLPTVVELQVSSAAQQGTGSGVVLRSDGYILTNAHVVEGTTRIIVTLQSGERVDAELVGSDATDDLAVVRVAKTGLQAATVGRSASLAVGQRVIAVGSSFGLEGSVTEGRQVTVSYLGVSGGAEDGDGQGARIQQVSPGGPAAEAGLRSGDLVTRVGDHTVRSWEDLVLAIRQLEAGSTVEVRVRRGSAEQTLQVTVGSRPVDSR
jgi:S1-C subfamily serine protease